VVFNRFASHLDAWKSGPRHLHCAGPWPMRGMGDVPRPRDLQLLVLNYHDPTRPGRFRQAQRAIFRAAAVVFATQAGSPSLLENS